VLEEDEDSDLRRMWPRLSEQCRSRPRRRPSLVCCRRYAPDADVVGAGLEVVARTPDDVADVACGDDRVDGRWPSPATSSPPYPSRRRLFA
jgi:hypothetical protein